MGLAFAADVPLMASTFCNRYGQRRLRMGSEPPAEEWEQTFGADLLPHLVPAEQPSTARQPLDPVFAYEVGCVWRLGDG